MRRIGLLLIGVLCLSVVVSVGEVITNNTGEDATGLRVTFSQPVLITAFGDILTSVDPQMLSFEFVFSGGTVESWGSQWFNYAPATASIIETEWLTGNTASAANRETTYRGVNVILEAITLGDLEILARDWNVNLIRVGLGTLYECGYFILQSEIDKGEVPCCSQTDFERLDWLLDTCESLNMRVLIDVHQFPGYHYIDAADYRLWTNSEFQNRLISFWKEIAARYSTRGDVVYGYDLLNEPRMVEPPTWNRLIKRITAAIREADPHHTIVVECAEYAEPYGFLSLVPTGDGNTIYSFHLWEPGNFTDQGLPGYPAIGIEWPSERANRESLKSWVKPVLDFQEKYDVPILVGELGVTVWASSESRAAYLRDAFDLFEEFGFDYAYWAYKAEPDFSLEHRGYVSDSGENEYSYIGETSELALVKEYFSRNEMPRCETPARESICLFDSSHWGVEAEELQYELDIAWRATSEYKVRLKTRGSISQSDLEGVELLVTGNPYGGRYSSGEISAIASFVRDGGSLLVYANSGFPSDWLNPLLSQFGIYYHPAQLRSSTPPFEDGDNRNFWITTFDSTHPIGEDASAYYITLGGSLDVRAPAISIAATESDVWRDLNRNGMREPSEESGPFAVIAAAELELGRVVAFSDDYFSSACNAKLLLAALSWLAR